MQHFALMQPDNLLRVLANKRQIMRDEQNRELPFRVDLRNEFEQCVRGGGVHASSRFVENEHFGFGRKRAGDEDALFLSTRKFGEFFCA